MSHTPTKYGNLGAMFRDIAEERDTLRRQRAALLKAANRVIDAVDLCELYDGESLIDTFTDEIENELRQAIKECEV